MKKIKWLQQCKIIWETLYYLATPRAGQCDHGVILGEHYCTRRWYIYGTRGGGDGHKQHCCDEHLGGLD